MADLISNALQTYELIATGLAPQYQIRLGNINF